ncbi:MAG: hypothetical protein RLZZ232_2702 [Planctomycetota bacterium]
MLPAPATSNPSILIAGCGYTGLRAAQLWQSRGLSVTAISRSQDRAALFRHLGLQPLVLNLAEPAAWPEFPAADVVVWCVGYDRSSGTSRRAVWIDGLSRFLQALPPATTSRRLILTSSTSVYGDSSGLEVNETTPPQPSQEGGQACLEAEQMLTSFAQQSGDVSVILRLAGIYGPDRLLRRLEDLHKGIPIAAHPDEWLNLVHVDDIVKALDHVAFCNSPPALMNVVSAPGQTREQYYQALATLANAPAPVFNPAAERPDTGRGRSGNRRVTSVVRSGCGLTFQYDDCHLGLQHALGLRPPTQEGPQR